MNKVPRRLLVQLLSVELARLEHFSFLWVWLLTLGKLLVSFIHFFFLYQAVNIFNSAVKYGILAWGLTGFSQAVYHSRRLQIKADPA